MPLAEITTPMVCHTASSTPPHGASDPGGRPAASPLELLHATIRLPAASLAGPPVTNDGRAPARSSPASRKAALVVLVDHAGDGAWALRVSTIADEMGTSDRTARSALDWLVAHGWVARERLHRDDGKRSVYSWRVSVARILDAAAGRAQARQRRREPAATVAGSPAATVAAHKGDLGVEEDIHPSPSSNPEQRERDDDPQQHQQHRAGWRTLPAAASLERTLRSDDIARLDRDWQTFHCTNQLRRRLRILVDRIGEAKVVAELSDGHYGDARNAWATIYARRIPLLLRAYAIHETTPPPPEPMPAPTHAAPSAEDSGDAAALKAMHTELIVLPGPDLERLHGRAMRRNGGHLPHDPRESIPLIYSEFLREQLAAVGGAP